MNWAAIHHYAEEVELWISARHLCVINPDPHRQTQHEATVFLTVSSACLFEILHGNQSVTRDLRSLFWHHLTIQGCPATSGGVRKINITRYFVDARFYGCPVWSVCIRGI